MTSSRRYMFLVAVERGRREVNNHTLQLELAKALRASVTDLLEQPVLMEDSERNDDILSVRYALMATDRLWKLLFSATPLTPYRTRQQSITPISSIGDLRASLGPSATARIS